MKRIHSLAIVTAVFHLRGLRKVSCMQLQCLHECQCHTPASYQHHICIRLSLSSCPWFAALQMAEDCSVRSVLLHTPCCMHLMSSCPVQVRESLMKRAREFNILMDDVAITHLSFGTEVRFSQPCQHLCLMPESMPKACHQSAAEIYKGCCSTRTCCPVIKFP